MKKIWKILLAAGCALSMVMTVPGMSVLAEELQEKNHYAARDIRRDEHSVRECMVTLLHGLKRQGQLRFEEAFSAAPTKEEVVTLFLALLELMRLGQAVVEQEGTYGEIVLRPGSGRRVDAKETSDDTDEP